ncbi:energy transducer TonB [Alistipes sp. ZOR0009]|uniref:energy transducer TonB n=1 Tax=Alistipes sp. ZOR0009 TaxID=1339253 RepID=UPI00068B83FE|nr:energy transducer TonB [Alistipes sp. ZOR0009]
MAGNIYKNPAFYINNNTVANTSMPNHNYNMKHFLLLISIILVTNFSSYCQSQQNGSGLIQITTPIDNKTFAIKKLTKDSVLLYTGRLSNIDQEIRQGKFYFFNNGKVCASGEYDQNIPTGLWIYYNETGDILYKINYSKVIDYLKNEAMNYTPDSVINKNFSKEDEKYMNKNGTFVAVEKMPVFNGNDTTKNFEEYVSKNLKYPIYAEKNGIEGTVWVTAIIDVNGKIRNPEIMKPSITDLNIEAIRVISESPAWKPGCHKKIPVNVLYIFPIKFKIRD